MIKAPIDLQDLRPRLYVKAKAEPSWRFTAPRLRLAAVASPMAIPAIADSGANMISLINLEMKCAGTRSAGNPHAACDVAGAGNGITNIPSRARRGQPRIQTRVVLSGYRASSRPYHASCLPEFYHLDDRPEPSGSAEAAVPLERFVRPCPRKDWLDLMLHSLTTAI